MAFQTPIKIVQALSRIENHEYVLPAIQREFVWGPDQVCRFFDSLMQGYPIGSFLFWKVDADRSRDYVFYDFIREYHEKNAPHCPKLDLEPGKSVTAILDGQQRLTALNVGLRGSYAAKLPYFRWDNPNAFPTKELYLNLCSRVDDDDMEMEYDFRFMTKEEAGSSNSEDNGTHWFLVKTARGLKANRIFHYIKDKGLANHDTAYDVLHRLHEVIHADSPINYFLEEDQDLDKVLNIFIRVNSAGTVLSYSDILLSIATAQWRSRDAREEIHRLVDSLNQIGQGFEFSKDLVLKAGLVLTDANDIRFKVANFNTKNMITIEDKWETVSKSLQRATQLMARFGFSWRTLPANNSVLIPVAYYLAHRELGDSYLDQVRYEDDREALQFWVTRFLVKAGVRGRAADTLLSALRKTIREDSKTGFPAKSMESAASLRFDTEEIMDLAERNWNTFPILTLLYPGINLNEEYHVDHIFPKSRFTRSQLRENGVPEDRITEFIEKVNRLPNLQLLPGPVNSQKSDKLPKEWARQRYTEEDTLKRYLDLHYMLDLPENITEFLKFYEERRTRIAESLRRLLGIK